MWPVNSSMRSFRMVSTGCHCSQHRGECKCHERTPGAGNVRQKAKTAKKQNILHFNHNKLKIKLMTHSNSDDIFSRAGEWAGLSEKHARYPSLNTKSSLKTLKPGCLSY